MESSVKIQSSKGSRNGITTLIILVMPEHKDISHTLLASRVSCRHLKSKAVPRKAFLVRGLTDNQGSGLVNQIGIITRRVIKDHVTTTARIAMKIKMQICSTTTTTTNRRILKINRKIHKTKPSSYRSKLYPKSGKTLQRTSHRPDLTTIQRSRSAQRSFRSKNRTSQGNTTIASTPQFGSSKRTMTRWRGTRTAQAMMMTSPTMSCLLQTKCLRSS